MNESPRRHRYGRWPPTGPRGSIPLNAARPPGTSPCPTLELLATSKFPGPTIHPHDERKPPMPPSMRIPASMLLWLALGIGPATAGPAAAGHAAASPFAGHWEADLK